MRLRCHDDEASRFECASQFLHRCPFDQRVDIELSKQDFHRLLTAAAELYGDESRYPSVEYNALLSRATITTDPSFLRSLMLESIPDLIKDFTVSKLKAHGFPEEVWSNLQRCREFEMPSGNRYSGSVKSVYNTLRFGDINRGAPNCAVIGGTMEEYTNIQEDVQLLLYGCNYPVVILACIEEIPVYKSPVIDEAVDCIRPDYEQEFSRLKEAFLTTQEKNPLGPYVYGDFIWVGKMATFFLEVYKRRGKSHRPDVTRHVIVENGQCTRDATITLDIVLRELVPVSQIRRSDIANMPIAINVERMINLLGEAMCETGQQRFQLYCLIPELTDIETNSGNYVT
ncbi:hypothetical protein V1506DRAFT_513320 [Lipomyces tetrasporus]